MTGFVRWLLAPAVVMAGLAFVGSERAEAARWRVHVHYPGYHATYVHRYRPYYYRAAPPVWVHAYRPAPAVVYPGYGYYAPYVPAPVVPYYYVW
jgi:hypothetical protein